MRLVLVPLILAAILAAGPTAVHANNNQAAAEAIAAGLGNRFPGYDIAVSYQNGKVRLVGQVGSPEMAQQVLDHVQKTPGVKVANIDNGLRVANMGSQAVVAPPKAAAVPSVPTNKVATQPVTPPQTKRSILTPPQAVQPQPQLASVPVPMPARQVVQVSANNEIAPPQAAPHPQMVRHPQAVPHPQAMPPQAAPMQHMPQHGMPPQQAVYNGQPISPQQLQMMQQQAMQQNAYHPEAYGPQGPMPGQYNHANLPDYAWPSYACYPNYAEVCYPKQYSPKAWPYIGPFYPYPQAPLGWRKVTLEHHDGWWWLDFDDGTPSGPFSPLFRQPIRYTY